MGLCSLLYKPILLIQGIKYGKGLNLSGFPVIAKNKSAQIEIGSGCHIKSSFLSNLVGLYQRSIIVARGTGKIKIGNRVGMSGVTIYARGKIEIGDRCIIGGNVKILDNDFHPVDPYVRAQTPSSNFGVAEIIIGEGVFIGCNALILKGTHIGDGAVVGAGSVVTKDVPPYTLVAGNPAKIVKQLDKNNG